LKKKTRGKKSRGTVPKHYSIIAITLLHVIALSYSTLALWRNVIASISYGSEHIEAIILSYSYCYMFIDQVVASTVLVLAFPSLSLLFNFSNSFVFRLEGDFTFF
jgi:hypothetical protein